MEDCSGLAHNALNQITAGGNIIYQTRTLPSRYRVCLKISSNVRVHGAVAEYLQRAGNATQEVQPEELAPSQPVFEPRPEKIQADHVEKQVHQPSMEEHIGDERPRPIRDQYRYEHEQPHQIGHDLRDEEHHNVGDQQPLDPGSHRTKARI